jgi:hypothetical protein
MKNYLMLFLFLLIFIAFFGSSCTGNKSGKPDLGKASLIIEKLEAKGFKFKKGTQDTTRSDYTARIEYGMFELAKVRIVVSQNETVDKVIITTYEELGFDIAKSNTMLGACIAVIETLFPPNAISEEPTKKWFIPDYLKAGKGNKIANRCEKGTNKCITYLKPTDKKAYLEITISYTK